MTELHFDSLAALAAEAEAQKVPFPLWCLRRRRSNSERSQQALYEQMRQNLAVMRESVRPGPCARREKRQRPFGRGRPPHGRRLCGRQGRAVRARAVRRAGKGRGRGGMERRHGPHCGRAHGGLVRHFARGRAGRRGGVALRKSRV